MASDPSQFLPHWHRIVETRDLVALGEVLAANPSLGAPPYWEKLVGHDIVHYLLGVILETILEFEYHREWRNDRELALEFTGRVGETELQGIDLITIDAQNQLVNIDVMIRPANAVQELIKQVTPRMTEFFAARSSTS